MKNATQKQANEMKKAVAATVMFLDTLFAETAKEEKQETESERSKRVFCGGRRKQENCLVLGY